MCMFTVLVLCEEKMYLWDNAMWDDEDDYYLRLKYRRFGSAGWL